MTKPDETPPLQAWADLIEVMARLRDPVSGCPWDIEQDFSTIAPYTIEEAYEVADAIERGNMDDLREELGDLALQIVFHSQMAAEAGHFNVSDVISGIRDKMIRRHPHVFDAPDGRDSDGQTTAWEVIKERERAAKGGKSKTPSALDGVALALPALLRSEKLQKRAARVGFDWPTADLIFAKLDEETRETQAAIQSGTEAEIEEEIGDMLFVVANLARRLKVDPEQALRKANAKFERRFRAMEAAAGNDNGLPFAERSLEDQEALWQSVKRDEKQRH